MKAPDDTNRLPGAAIGHVVLQVSKLPKSVDFYRALGLRLVSTTEQLAILELRGGTHLLLFPSKKRKNNQAGFDLIVKNLGKHHKKLTSLGFELSPIRNDERSGHDMFDVRDPDGLSINILSDHTEGRPV